MDEHDVEAVSHLTGFQHRTERIVGIRLVDDIQVTGMLSDDVVQQDSQDDVACRVVGIAYPVETVLR